MIQYIDKEKLLESIYEKGEIDYLFSPTKEQVEMYSFFNEIGAGGIGYVNAVRGFGKTLSVMFYLHKMCLVNPGRKILFVGTIRSVVEELIDLHLTPMLDKAPDKYRPTRSISKYQIDYKNGSTWKFFGVDKDRSAVRRGPQYDIIYIDEIASIDGCHDMVMSVFYSMVERRGGKIIITTTPPDSPYHECNKIKMHCISKGKYFERSVYSCSLYGEERIKKIKSEITKDAWEREYELLEITNKSRVAIPEFDANLHVVQDIVLPDYYDRYVVADLGFSDFTAMLWVVYDFMDSNFIVIDELFVRNSTTENIAEMFKKKEKELGGHTTAMYSDNNAQQLHDLSFQHGVTFIPKTEYDRDASVNRLRVMFQKNKIRIKSTCVGLIDQFKYGIVNKKGTDWERLPGLGHLDGIDALRHGLPMIDTSRNPYPVGYGLTQFQIRKMSRDELMKGQDLGIERIWENEYAE
jgi:hypothetical protein